MDLLDDDGLLDLRRRGRATDPRSAVAEERRRRDQAADDEPDWGSLGADAEGGRDGSDGADAVPEGTCPICKRRAGALDCRSCGRRVCKSDAWIMFGLCRTCAKEDRVQRWNEQAAPEDRNWLQE